jgi:hypothetical protein
MSAEWISIKEKQPEVGKIVLCKCLEDYPQTGYLVKEIDYGDEGISYIFKSVYDKFIVVEAWSEIPE